MQTISIVSLAAQDPLIQSSQREPRAWCQHETTISMMTHRNTFQNFTHSINSAALAYTVPSNIRVFLSRKSRLIAMTIMRPNVTLMKRKHQGLEPALKRTLKVKSSKNHLVQTLKYKAVMPSGANTASLLLNSAWAAGSLVHSGLYSVLNVNNRAICSNPQRDTS